MAAVLVVLGGASPTFGQNLVQNGDFSSSLAFWSVELNGSAVALHDPTDGYPSPGSVRFVWNGADPGTPQVSQCIPVAPGEKYEYGAYGTLGEDPVACGIGLQWFAEPNCVSQGGPPPPGSVLLNQTDWVHMGVAPATAPAGTASARISVACLMSHSYLASIDAVYFRPYAKGDFDQDGASDLVLSEVAGSALTIWTMNGAVRTSFVPVTPAPSSLQVLRGTDDFNRDGHPDLVFQTTPGLGGGASVWLMNGAQRYVAPVGIGTPGAGWQIAATGDFDADDNADIVWRNTTTQSLLIWTMNGATKKGEIVPSPDHALASNWRVVATADFDKDAATDFLWYNPDSGKIVFWWMDSGVVRLSGQFANPPNAGHNNWKVVAASDYAVGAGGMLGTQDIVWRNETSGKQVIWYMDALGNRTSATFTSPDAPESPLSWQIVAPR